MPSSHDWRHPLKRWWDTSPIPLELRGRAGLHHWSLAPESRFLNHGSYGARLRRTVACQHRLAAAVESDPMRMLTDQLEAKLHDARCGMAQRLGADPEGLVFCENASTAIESVLRSVPLKAGDRVVCLGHVYNAVRQALKRRCQETGAAAIEVPVTLPFDAVALEHVVMAEIHAGASLCILDAITSGSALRTPWMMLAAKIKSCGVPVLVDGAHVPGQDPLVLRDLEYDWFAGNLHKWAGAPVGAAVLSVAPEHREKTFALLTSHHWDEGLSRSFHWTGTRDWSPWLAAPEAWDHMEELSGGWEGLRAYQRAGSQAVDEAFTMAFGTESITPESARTAMCSVPLPASLQGIDCLKFEHDFDQRFGLRVPMHALSDQTMVRVSIHLHTELEDIFALGEAIMACAQKQR
jgi:isopenicillin-N epimerase